MTTDNNRPQNTSGYEKKQLTDTQLRIIQLIAGLLAAAALIVSIYVSSLPVAEDNILLQYLFLIVFLVVIFGRRRIEQRFRLRLNLFSLAMIDGIVIGIIIYALPVLYPADSTAQTVNISDSLKTLILVVVFLLLLGLGIILPYLRYRKRVENGTQPPVRIPEPEEEPEPEETKEEEANAKLSPIERQIKEMTEELKDDDKDNR